MKLFVFVLLTLPAISFAQVPYLPELELPIPDIYAIPVQSPVEDLRPLFKLSSKDVDAIALSLHTQFSSYADRLKQAAPECTSAEATEYALALHIAGRFDECVKFARVCGAVSSSLRVSLRGALCAADNYDYLSADGLFTAATDARFAADPDLSEAVYLYAAYAIFGVHEDQVQNILKLQSSWTPAERELWDGVIRRVGRTGGAVVGKPQVDEFINQQIASAAPGLQSLLKSLKIDISMRDHRYEDSLKELKAFAPEMKNPLLWYFIAYNTVYYGLDTDFALSRKVYDAYEPFSHARTNFPNENNTYNYSEIYSTVCPGELTQGLVQSGFKAFKSRFQSGQVRPVDAVTWLENFDRQNPRKADVLTALGSLYAMLDRHDDAVAVYWKAHKLCRYYNRANWGLNLEKRYAKIRQMPDFQKNVDRVDRELNGLTLPPEMPQYITNWNALSAEAQRRVYYGARIWLPYIDDLVRGQRSTYIKHPFELLSESPEWAQIHDARVSLKNDKRLWDDVRGIGGNPVVADLVETMQTVQGDYNLLGHEMAHQFEFLMGEFFSPGQACITKLYQKGLKTDLFPDAYAKTNQQEHFAQEVTYFLVPEDSPKRFGLTKTWLIEEDPTYLKFIESIVKANGTLTKIECPI